MSLARSGHSCCIVGNFLCVVAGGINYGDPNTIDMLDLEMIGNDAQKQNSSAW